MPLRTPVLLALALASAPAAAASAPDLTTAILAPTGAHVYETARWQVVVSNGGTKDAAGTTVHIDLPATNTSPTVHVMGTLGAKSASCTQSGTSLTCSVGTLRKGRSTTVYFDIALPENAGPLVVDVTASTTTSEPNTGNNDATATASLLNYTPSFTGTVDVDNRHCTGTNLTSFFECALYPSSISAHVATLEAGGTVSFPDEPDYDGTWSLVGDELSFEYTYFGDVQLEFVGYGVSATCWEGLAIFPGSTYVAPYEVCL